MSDVCREQSKWKRKGVCAVAARHAGCGFKPVQLKVLICYGFVGSRAAGSFYRLECMTNYMEESAVSPALRHSVLQHMGDLWLKQFQSAILTDIVATNRT
jgi:hypothetical protein